MTVSGDGLEVRSPFDDACREIKEGIVLHPYFIETKRKILRALKTDDMVLLVGPTGVGKGTLVYTLVEELNVPVQDDPVAIRAIYFRCPSAHGTRYPWFSFYYNWSDALQEPLPGRKIDHERLEAHLREGRSKRSLRGGKAEDLRRAVFKSTRSRGVRAVFADEAANLVIQERGRTMRDRLDVLRDISDMASEEYGGGSPLTIVLVSTPRIFGDKGLGLSGELIRRMEKIYFNPYSHEGGLRGAGFRAFHKLAQAFGDHLPPEMRPELTSDNVKELLEGSIGCVGFLAKWFIRAIRLCEDEGSGKLEWQHFESTKYSAVDLDQLEKECATGENYFEENMDRRNYGKRSPGTMTKGVEGLQEEGKPKGSKANRSGKTGRDAAAIEGHELRDNPPQASGNSGRKGNRRIGLPGPDRPPAGGYTEKGETE